MKSKEDLRRAENAIKLFVSMFGGSYEKLGPLDIDYKIFNSDGEVLGYAEVTSRHRTMRDSYPLPISASKLVKLFEKRLNPVAIWACDDGLIYTKLSGIRGELISSDNELTMFFEKQKSFKYVKFV